ncbi:MAG: hypothetical protein OFPI_33850 [Osedax symbiont Rs2]|nr:MAG: hypothetical protein OFPI_33850 [Osedax symbiont Rs2]
MLQVLKYGDDQGKIVFYFHGAPGAPAEAAMLEQAAIGEKFCIISFNRFAIDAAIDTQRYYQLLAEQIASISDGQKVDLIGFSIGCHVAIEVALLLEKQLASLHLVSAAAPLEGGDFLVDMAGGAVFKLAQKAPLLFVALSYWQKLLAKFASAILYKMLFSSARGKDKELAASVEFQQLLMPILADCFSRDVSGYIRDVKAYVKPWSAQLGKLQVNSYLYHGQADNWSGLSMAHYLRDTLGSRCQLKEYPELSHYSCLNIAVVDIFQQLKQD